MIVLPVYVLVCTKCLCNLDNKNLFLRAIGNLFLNIKFAGISLKPFTPVI